MRSQRDDLETQPQSTQAQLQSALDDRETTLAAKDAELERHRQEAETRDAELATTQASLREAEAKILELKQARLDQGRKREELSSKPYSSRRGWISGAHMKHLMEELERVNELGAQGMGMAVSDFQALYKSLFEEFMLLDAEKAERGWHVDF